MVLRKHEFLFLIALAAVLLASGFARAEQPADTSVSETGEDQLPPFENGHYNFAADFPEAAPPKRKPKACWKDSEPRGKGRMPDPQTRQCPENQERSMGLCYPMCGPKRVGWGPLCLDDCKSTALYTSSAALFCCQTDEVCRDLMQAVATKVPRALVRLAIDIATNPNDARKIAGDFRAFLAEALQLRLPLCSKVATLSDSGEVDDAADPGTVFAGLEDDLVMLS